MRHLYVWSLENYHKITEGSNLDPCDTYYVKPTELYQIERLYENENIEYIVHFID